MGVEELEETLTDDELAGFWALSIVDDWGGDWRRTAAICCEIFNASIRLGRLVVAAAVNPETAVKEANQLKFKKPEDFEPQFKWQRKKKKKQKKRGSFSLKHYFASLAGVPPDGN